MRRFARTILPAFILTCSSIISAQQQTFTKEPGALSVLAKSPSAIAVTTAGQPLRDFVAHGNITYFLYPKNRTGTVTFKGAGDSQFCMDSELSDGHINWCVNNGKGTFKDAAGKLKDIPFHNAISLGALTLPQMRLGAAIEDQATEIHDLGFQSIQGHGFHKIHVTRHLATGIDPHDIIGKLRTADYFFDSSDLKLTGVIDKTHPVQTSSEDIQRAMYFSDVRTVNGIAVPFSVTEEIGGQKIWSVALSDISFNSGLTDSDFDIQ